MIEENKKINLGNGQLFKAFIQDDRCRPMVAAVLHQITGLEEEKLLHARYASLELPKKQSKEKGKASDILIEVDKDTIIILEMNQQHYSTLFQKNISYAFATYNRRVHVREKKYPVVIIVNINCFDYFKYKSLLEFKIQTNTGIEEIPNFKSYPKCSCKV